MLSYMNEQDTCVASVVCFVWDAKTSFSNRISINHIRLPTNYMMPLSLSLSLSIYIYIYIVFFLWKGSSKPNSPNTKIQICCSHHIQKDILYPIYHCEEQSKISHTFSTFLICLYPFYCHMNPNINLNFNGIELASILLS